MTTRADKKALWEAEAEKQARIESDRLTVKADTFISSFVAMTPAQVRAYVDANVTDLASSRTLLKRMAVMLLVLAKKEFTD